jgi:AcrR family transcriptional regulator
VPKEVDHPARRRELADAACRVIARNGLAGTTLAHVATESGWSIGSIRYYFPNKDELVASALWRVGERVDERIRQRTGEGMTLDDLRAAAVELLPLDTERREESLVHLAFLAQVAVVPELAGPAEDAARRLQEPLAARIAYAARAGELPAGLDAEEEAERLRVLLDGLRLQLITTPQRTSAQWALAVLDDHFAALATGQPVRLSADLRRRESRPLRPLARSVRAPAHPTSGPPLRGADASGPAGGRRRWCVPATLGSLGPFLN